MRKSAPARLKAGENQTWQRTWRGYLALLRPANLPSAAADVIAGICIALATTGQTVPPAEYFTLPICFLVLASVFLYAGGVVLNDVADRNIDAVDRPDRPIPAGEAQVTSSGLLGFTLLLIGLLCAFYASNAAGSALVSEIVSLLSVCILVYIFLCPRHCLAEPCPTDAALPARQRRFYLAAVFMAACRGLNLALGMSIFPDVLLRFWFLPASSFLYVFVLTLLSQQEVYQGTRLPPLLFSLTACAIAVVAISFAPVSAWIFAAMFLLFLFPAIMRMVARPSSANVKAAVGRGVLAIILLDAMYCASVGELRGAAFLFFLLALSLLLAGRFRIT